jgi:hypothetical protein
MEGKTIIFATDTLKEKYDWIRVISETSRGNPFPEGELPLNLIDKDPPSPPLPSPSSSTNM